MPIYFSQKLSYLLNMSIFSLFYLKTWGSVQSSSVAQSCPTLCDPMNCSTPGLPIHHQLPELTQTHIHWVSDAIQPSHPLSSPSPLAPNPSQHQSLFQWVNSSSNPKRCESAAFNKPANLENSAVAIALEKMFSFQSQSKAMPKKCSNYNTIALISHISKVMFKILQSEASTVCELRTFICSSWLWKGRETRGQIANICWIIEKSKRVP